MRIFHHIKNPPHAIWTLVHNGKGVCSNCHRLDGIDPLATHCRYCGMRIYLREEEPRVE